MEVSARNEEDLFVVRVEESRIDAQVALAFKEAMRRNTEETSKKILLDLGNVTFIDSSGLGAIVAIMNHLSPERQLVLAGLTPTVEKVFRLTRMDQVFDLYLALDDAIAAHRA